MDLKYFKNLKKEATISKRYRELAKMYHPDKAVNDAEREHFHSIMSEINAEHQEVLVLLKYRAFEKQKIEVVKENIVVEKISTSNFLKNITSVFNLTDAQKDYFIRQGRDALTTLYDNIIENNFKR
jgi:curved DNA-binding protein CbpA